MSDIGDDADAGEQREDILEINAGLNLNHLFEGDIAGDPRRNAILNETLRWKFPIPYILTDSLELNAKGVIHQAFEAYRLKSCVDFKPYEGESTYLSFTKLSGCWSFVGDFGTGQNISIGERCDTKATVEHELLHALGFYHEQSRSDRDDYVKIWWDQIQEGKEHNFNKYEDDFVTDLNTPYDYESIMHYRPLSFNKNASVPTITTAIPAFNEIIGQRLDFSEVDLTRLNRMYDCTRTHTLLDQCSFELINICGMIQNEADNADWVQTLSTGDLPDHTLTGRCRDAGYFMKFDTSSGDVGASALLESRVLYPQRSQQCLQFFYKMTGAAGDKLVVWVRTDDGTGNVVSVRKMHSITGNGDEAWKIAQVTLKVKDKFRYFFQGTRGTAGSSGAILIDDITLTETACPSAMWTIPNFSGLLAATPVGGKTTSPCFCNAEGYSFGLNVYPNGRDGDSADYVAVTFHLCSGENDGVMEWPAVNRQATLTTMDQDPDVKLRMSSTRSFTTDTDPRWNKPTTAVGLEYGWSTFISHKQLHRRSFLKNNDLIITADFDDLTHMLKTEVPVKPAAPTDGLRVEEPIRGVGESRGDVSKHRAARDAPGYGCHTNTCLNGGVCPSGQATYYAGARCEQQHIYGSILGVLIGGAVGMVILTLAILLVIRRPR
ncbi:meprin A subunit alpha [Aplochiton taeniatus]